MEGRQPDHTLEFLLAFHGREHWLQDDYCVRFEIRRVKATPSRPHGLQYSFTLHDPHGKRLVGFDNAHPISSPGSRPKAKPEAADHWHRTADDKGQPYMFVDAETLIADFFKEVYRVLEERGIPTEVVRETDRRSKK
jgi:hypothetical protein